MLNLWLVEKNIIEEFTLGKLPKVEWEYPFCDTNQQGYRCDEFDIPHDLSVVTLGCSNGFGYAIKRDERFSDIFVSNLAKLTCKEVANWNISLPGKSNDYMARTVLSMPHTLKPDIILVSLTGIGRREHFDANFDIKKNKRCYDHVPSNRETIGQYQPHFLKTCENFESIASPFDDSINFYKNYKLIEMTCKLNNIQLLFTTSLCYCAWVMDFVVQEPLYVGPFTTKDYAGDGLHPGPKSNQIIANDFWEKYKSVYMD